MKGPVLVLGAGLSGLAASHALRAQGYDVTIIEGQERAGGTISSEERAGFQLEWGPNSFPGSATRLLEFVHAVGCGDAIVPAAAAARDRWVYFHGGLHRAPRGPGSLIASTLLSPIGKVRAALEPLVLSRAADGESVADFVRRRLGREVAERLVQPFVSGVYAGVPGELDMDATFPRLYEWERRQGGLLMGALRDRGRGATIENAGGGAAGARGEADASARREAGGRRMRGGIFTIAGGMERLARSAARLLGASLQVGARVERIQPVRDGWEVQVARVVPGAGAGAGVECTESFAAPRLVVALPAHAGASLFRDIDADLAAGLAGIPYASLALLHASAPRGSRAGRRQGFGFLNADLAGLPVLGAIFAASAFPHRAPAERALFTVYLGGRAQGDVLKLEDGALVERALDGLARALGDARESFEPIAMRRIDAAIPQFVAGHKKRMARMALRVASFHGLAFAGNYLRGVSMDHAVASGEEAAASILEQDFARAAIARGG